MSSDQIERKLYCAPRWIACGGLSAMPRSSVGGSGSASTGSSSRDVGDRRDHSDDSRRGRRADAGTARGEVGHVADRRGRAAAAAGIPVAPVRVEPGTDYSQEPTTLVEFTLAETNGGVLLRIVESGFDKIPPSVGHRRSRATRGLGQADRTGV